jgi:hypothetical protein
MHADEAAQQAKTTYSNRIEEESDTFVLLPALETAGADLNLLAGRRVLRPFDRLSGAGARRTLRPVKVRG